jgi:hypothetical protein
MICPAPGARLIMTATSPHSVSPVHEVAEVTLPRLARVAVQGKSDVDRVVAAGYGISKDRRGADMKLHDAAARDDSFNQVRALLRH